jgi:fatty acid desaturase
MATTLNSTSEVRKLIPFKKIGHLHKVSDFRGLFSVLLEWFLIVGVALLSEFYFSWFLYPVIVIFIGARYLALGLIMHEAVHQLISKNKWVNDWVAEIFCSWPILVSMRSYKIKHLAHHAWLNTDDDPDYTAKNDSNWRYPMKKLKFFKVLITQVSGLGVLETIKVMSSSQMKVKKNKTPVWYNALRVVFYTGVIGAFVITDNVMIFVLYWVVPFFTWTQIANRLRRIAEHSAIEGKSPEMQTRTTKHGLLGRLLLAPKNIAFHNEHHIYPGIPCYNLPKVHKILEENEIVRENLHVCGSYEDVYKECII